MATRRGFLAGLAALTLPKPSWADVGQPAYLAAAKRGEDFFLHGLSETGQSLFSLPLPGRGHAAAAHPTRPLAVAFARRPGTFAVVIDCRTGEATARLAPPDNRQFNGHGVFVADGSVLYTSEVVADGSAGRIGLWETDRFSRIGEWSSGGIGPHDMKRLGDRLVVANGGIKTDPKDRSKLNIDTMRPNLSLIGTDGVLEDQVELEPALHQNSIRHLALAPGGQIAFAMQWEGDPAEAVPLLGLWTPGTSARLCPSPEEEAHRMKGYAGSIAANASGQIAMTSPRGGVAMLFGADGMHLSTVVRNDICGVARHGSSGFIFSDGNGALLAFSDDALIPLVQIDVRWDNHIVAL